MSSIIPLIVDGAKSLLELALTPQASLEEYRQHLLDLARKASDEIARRELSE